MTIGGVLSVRSVAVGLAVGTLGALLRADLQSKGCGRLSSIAASGFAIAQPAFLDPAIALKAVLLAFSTYAISVNAVAFSDSRDPRRIIRLGGSLASAQVLNPLMGTLVSLGLPFALRRPKWRSGLAHAVGLYVVLLFIPVLTVVILVCVWRAHPGLEIFSGLPPSTSSQYTIGSITLPLLAAIPITPAIACACIIGFGTRSCEIPASFAALAVAAGAVTSWLGVRQHPVELIATLSPLSITAFAPIPAKQLNAAVIQFNAVSTCLLSWGVSFALTALA